MPNYFGDDKPYPFPEKPGMTGINLPYPAKPVTPEPSIAEPAPAPAWDYWATLQGILGDVDQGQFDQIKNYYGARKNWRVPKDAQDMLTLASLMKTLGDDASAQQLAVQSLTMGFRQPTWNLSAMFGPQLEKWGLGFGSPTAGATSSRRKSSSSQNDLLSMLAGMM